MSPTQQMSDIVEAAEDREMEADLKRFEMDCLQDDGPFKDDAHRSKERGRNESPYSSLGAREHYSPSSLEDRRDTYLLEGSSSTKRPSRNPLEIATRLATRQIFPLTADLRGEDTSTSQEKTIGQIYVLLNSNKQPNPTSSPKAATSTPPSQTIRQLPPMNN